LIAPTLIRSLRASKAAMPTTIKLLTIGGFLAFFVFGFIDNLKGPLLPELLRSGDFSYSQGGTILFASYLGFIFSTLATGVMSDVISNRSVLRLAAISLCIGSIGFSTATSYLALILFMGISGIGLGAIELGANGLMIELHDKARGRYLNLLATFHGCGSLLVPLYVAWMLSRGNSWQWVYGSTFFLAAPLLPLFWSRGHTSANLAVTQPRADWDWREFWLALSRTGFSLRMRFYYLIIAAYVAVELSVAAWMMECLQQDRSMSVGVSSLYLSSFFVLLMLGRFLGSFVVDRFEPLRIVFAAIAASAVCLAIGIFGSNNFVIFFPLSAFFMSIVFPTVTASVTREHIGNTGTILGLLFACGGVGGALGPWTVGLLSDVVGLKLGLTAPLGFAATALIAILLLQRVAPPRPA